MNVVYISCSRLKKTCWKHSDPRKRHVSRALSASVILGGVKHGQCVSSPPPPPPGDTVLRRAPGSLGLALQSGNTCLHNLVLALNICLYITFNCLRELVLNLRQLICIIIIRSRSKICLHLLNTVHLHILFQTSLTVFLLSNTKEDILKSIGKQTTLEPIDFYCIYGTKYGDF